MEAISRTRKTNKKRLKIKKMEMNPQVHAAHLVLTYMAILVKKQESKLCAKKHCELIIERYESIVEDELMIDFYNNVIKYIDLI